MDIRQTCCSVDGNELSFPSFSVVFIHTFMIDGDISAETVTEEERKKLEQDLNDMRELLKEDPDGKVRPVSSLVEYLNIKNAGEKPEIHFEHMHPEVETLLFPSTVVNGNKVARYSMQGFDFRIPVRASKEKNKDGEYVPDFPSVDFEGHVNVEVSQFLGNIFSVTYRFLFDGFTCKILEPDEKDNKGMGCAGRKQIEATTNHLISLVSSCLGAEYWSDDDDDDKAAGIDLKNRLVIDRLWVDYYGDVVRRDDKGNSLNPLPKDEDGELLKEEQEDGGIWTLESQGRVFDKVLLRYKKYLAKRFLGAEAGAEYIKGMSVVSDSRYAMVDIWETVKHPYGSAGNRDLFSDKHWPKLGEAGIINHIRDYHKPELVGLMSMYPAEWPYRASEAYDEVCGENIAIDTDDLVLAGSHMTVVIGTYGRRGDGVDGVNWEKVMKERRFYHVSWEEYLLIVQFVLAKKYSFNNAIDSLLRLTDDMTQINKKKIGICAKSALAASKRAIELDVIRHMKFPSHKVMYDRSAKRLELDNDFQRFKDVQEVVSGNLQSLGEYHAARTDSWMNTGLIAISVLSLFELAFQENSWPFVSYIFKNETCDWEGFASVISLIAAICAFAGFIWVVIRCFKQIKEGKN